MYLASIDFSSMSASTSAAPLVSLLLVLLFLAPCAMMMVVAAFRPLPVPPGPVGEFRRAKDGRAFIQCGRVCHFGRRGESEASLRARLSL